MADTEKDPELPETDQVAEVGNQVIDWDPEDHGAKRYNPSDPLGQVSIFEETGGGIPTFDSASARRVFEYVDRKARSVGAYIPKNRGVPATVKDTSNMLSQEEKAVVILGRAIGVPYRAVVERLNQLRTEAGAPPITSDPGDVCSVVASRHKEIVTAIQADMLAAVEGWSPLVGGQQRFVWHARMIELYRATIQKLAKEPVDSIRRIDDRGRVFWLDKIDEIRRLDKAMASHMKFFEDVGVSGDLSALLSRPSDRIREQQVRKAEEDIEVLHAEGHIDDVERLKRLRALRHGEEVEEG